MSGMGFFLGRCISLAGFQEVISGERIFFLSRVYFL